MPLNESPKPTKNVCIVGHGPSLLNKRLGDKIDSYDFVVRQKRCQETLKHPTQYGTRIDAVCGSWTIAPSLFELGANEVWVFLDSRHDSVNDLLVREVSQVARIDWELCKTWDGYYRELRTEYDRPDERIKEFDPLGHPHLSAGFHTLIYACEFLKPETVTLAGFDNVQTGDFTWSITRGPEWSQYPGHRWDIEHEMIKDVEDAWSVKVEFI